MALCPTCVPTERIVGDLTTIVCRNCGARLATEPTVEEEPVEEVVDEADLAHEAMIRESGVEFLGDGVITHPTLDHEMRLEDGEYVVFSATTPDELRISVPGTDSQA